MTTPEDNGKRSKCKCGVPHDVHGTCCDWYNAKISVSPDGKIIEPEHPNRGKDYNEWINERFYPALKQFTIIRKP